MTAIHHLKGLAALFTAVAVITGAVVGLRFAIAPDQPTFSDAVAAADEGDEPFLPEAVGGEFQVAGDREGTFSLTREVGPPGYGLGGDDGRMHFDDSGENLEIAQFSYDGLDFFPDAEECSVTPGEVDSARGVAAAEVECPDITDVRDTGTITLQGRVGLPAAMVTELNLPDIGGTFTAGEVTWEVAAGQFLVMEDEGITPAGAPMSVSGFEFSMEFGRQDGAYTLERVNYRGSVSEVPPGTCSVEAEELGALSPEAVRLEVRVDCEAVEIEGLGEVPIEGSTVVDQLTVVTP